MRLLWAMKAFIKAFMDPSKGKQFVEEKEIKSIPQKTISTSDSSDFSHLRLLAILQHSSRLIDFLKEDISNFSDDQVGAAIRQIHIDCGKSLEDLVTIRPILDEKEGGMYRVSAGYDPTVIKVIGKVKGEPPYSGTVVHRGWKAHKKSLPKMTVDKTFEIISPAEIEVK